MTFLLLATGSAGALAARDAALDHIILAVPDLPAYVAELERQTGVAATFGGAHPGLGTANYLASLTEGVYLEILGPDPSLDTPVSLGESLAALTEPTLAWFALTSSDIEATVAELRAAGLELLGPSPGSRVLPGGERLDWQALLVTGHEYGDFVPFVIDWGDSRHPSTSSATGLRLVAFSIEHPRAAELNELFARLGLGALAEEGTLPGFSVELAFDGGALALSNHYRQHIFAPLLGAPGPQGPETP